MEQQDIDNLRMLMEFEAARTEPPKGFPMLPDLPAGRYTDRRFYDLEKDLAGDIMYPKKKFGAYGFDHMKLKV